ncbi:papain-like cysteine protease family protein [Flavobacterium notoginsengisoli]|uniref:papain-like cysteine protease family protein n=1 Tax=Flavobacterium notoginsengisoli TaxID=1478199 RepID=UPI00362DBC0D
MIASLSAIFFTWQIYSQTYSVDIPNAQYLYAKQKECNCCWAACNQMLLKAFDINESQENQSMKVFGSVVNQGAGPTYELAKVGLRGTYSTNSGESIAIIPYVSYLSQMNNNDPWIIIDQLSDGIPLVMATRAHGVVCVGVDYVKNNSNLQITALRLLDPRPDGSSVIIQKSINALLQEGLMGFMTCNVR